MLLVTHITILLHNYSGWVLIRHQSSQYGIIYVGIVSLWYFQIILNFLNLIFWFSKNIIFFFYLPSPSHRKLFPLQSSLVSFFGYLIFCFPVFVHPRRTLYLHHSSPTPTPTPLLYTPVAASEGVISSRSLCPLQGINLFRTTPKLCKI